MVWSYHSQSCLFSRDHKLEMLLAVQLWLRQQSMCLEGWRHMQAVLCKSRLLWCYLEGRKMLWNIPSWAANSACLAWRNDVMRPPMAKMLALLSAHLPIACNRIEVHETMHLKGEKLQNKTSVHSCAVLPDNLWSIVGVTGPHERTLIIDLVLSVHSNYWLTDLQKQLTFDYYLISLVCWCFKIPSSGYWE